MKGRHILRIGFSIVFSAIILFTVSVREVHYLFVAHTVENEKCDNHLHGSERHADCLVCKFDITAFTDKVDVPVLSPVYVTIQKQEFSFTSRLSFPVLLQNALRGPPSLA